MNERYPDIGIRSKNELAKRIISKSLSYEEALELINDVLEHYDKYWKDNLKMSQPKKNKWVRSAYGTKLGKLLKLINTRVLNPYDSMLPDFIFGSVSGKNHKAAVLHLLGSKQKRMLLALDLKRFFEQNQYDRVRSLFAQKCGCHGKGATTLADLCCVPIGAKDAPGNCKTIARGFSPSPRLAVWCNLDAFIRIDRVARKVLKDKDYRIAIYVDDIGITASKVTVQDMIKLHKEIDKVLKTGDKNQPLLLNDDKSRIVNHDGSTYDMSGNLIGKWAFEHLGIVMGRKSLAVGSKTRLKYYALKQQVEKSNNKSKLKRSRKALKRYKHYIESK
ncbi:reverse transcriptase domain-containing protein [Candidatus Saccharibacteria bacterium]|nr:reverse transcriptase domain-containing protein [Candidatus Saccharibacteria bacterium]